MSASNFATLTFERQWPASASIIWQAWTDPRYRELWAAPAPTVTVDFLEADLRVGGREVSVCRVEGQPDIRCEVGWLVLDPARRSVNYEVVDGDGITFSTALVTADIVDEGESCHFVVTIQLSNQSKDMEGGYRAGFNAGLDNLGALIQRTMTLERIINAPVAAVWAAWTDPAALPQWWGPDGFSCRTTRIDLRDGGEWVFDMIGPDGTVFPNHHAGIRHDPMRRIAYSLLWGENGPKHADATVVFDDLGDHTRVTLAMTFVTVDEYQNAKGFGAVELGQQTLRKLADHLGASGRTPA